MLLTSRPTLEKPAQAGVRSARASTGSIAGGGAAEITLTWPTAFPDTNYTVVASVEEGTANTNTLRVRKIVSRTASDVRVRVSNEDTLNAKTGTLHVIGIPD